MIKTRILFCSDVHGSEVTFKKFTNAGKFYNADVVIMGGDLTAKTVVPIIKQDDGSYNATYLGGKYIVRTEKELEKLESKIRFVGYIPYLTDVEEMEELSSDPKKIDDLFSRLMIDTIRRWIRLAEDRLKGTGIRCFMMPGNDDNLVIDSVFDESDYVVNPEGKAIYFDDVHEMISTGFSNISPWKCPRDIPEEELAKRIEVMTSKVENMRNCIFNFHCPPFQSGLDEAPKLDENFRPIIKGGKLINISAGSVAVRDAIERNQPMLGLHGHIHESRGACRIGRTLCLNPGSEYSEGILRGVMINLKDGNVESNQFTSG